MDGQSLYTRALEAAKNAYAPYSKFRVGAALLCDDGSVFIGVNVENRSFGLTICAERGAVMAAACAGKRSFVGIAVATPDAAYPVSPCGACRQVLSEFMRPDAVVVFGSSADKLVTTNIAELFPYDALHELAD